MLDYSTVRLASGKYESVILWMCALSKLSALLSTLSLTKDVSCTEIRSKDKIFSKSYSDDVFLTRVHKCSTQDPVYWTTWQN